MSMTVQIFWGSVVLGICAVIQLLMLVNWARLLQGIDGYFRDRSRWIRLFFLISGTFAVIVAVHTIHVWLWAGFILLLGALNTLPDAIYFSLVTYTTVGYGDLTIGPDFRVFAAMDAVSGLLSFGVSTAFLVSLLSRLFPEHLE